MNMKRKDPVRVALNAIRAEIHKHAKDMDPEEYEYLLQELISDCEGVIEGLYSEDGKE